MGEGLANPHWQFTTTLTSKENDTIKTFITALIVKKQIFLLKDRLVNLIHSIASIFYMCMIYV